MGKKWFASFIKRMFVCQSEEKVKGSPRVASPRVASRSPRPASSSPPSLMNTTLRDYHAASASASAIKIQASFRGYMARRRFRALRGLVRLQRVVQGPQVKRQTMNAMKQMQLLVRVQSQIHSRRIQMMMENQAFESVETESVAQARQYQNYRLALGRTNSSLESSSRFSSSYSFTLTSSSSSVLMSSKQPRTPPSGRMLQGSSSSSSVNNYSRSRASGVPNYMAPTVSSKAKVSYWIFQDTRWQGT